MIKRFFSYYKPHKKLFAFDLFCALLQAACTLAFPLITKNIINDYVPNKRLNLLIIWCSVLLAIYLLKAILAYIIQYWGHVLGVRIQSDMRKAMFRHLQKLPFTFFDENKTGAIMSRLVNDLFDISELAHHAPEDLFISAVTIIGSFVILATINLPLTVIVFCFIPLMLFFAVKSRKRMNAAFKKMREETANVNADVETAVSGVRVTKAYACEDYIEKRFENTNEKFVSARSKAYKAMGVFNSGMGFISDFLYLVVLLFGGLFFYFEVIDTGEFAAYILYISMLLTPIRSFVAIFEQIQSGATGFARFCEVMDEEPEKDNDLATVLTHVDGNIEFKNVCFSYETSGEVVSGLNITVEKGKTTALVGGSGGGKTTVCNLLLHFYDIADGEILINGKNINGYTRKSLRENIGIVAQDVFIFDGTIKENIAFGKIGATDEEIIDAAKRANIHDYVMTLPDKYDTWVGERGVKLSGGQRQRVSIARAFLKNPPVLILDEATSALDNVTEYQIQRSLNELSVGRTVLVVAHRLSTIEKADKIYVIEDGKAVESGTHKELLASGGRYATLAGALKNED